MSNLPPILRSHNKPIVYRSYTSDIPNQNTDNGFGKTLFLYEGQGALPKIPRRKFVMKIPTENYQMEPIDVPFDIISVIISFGPCKWYTVSKATHKIAEAFIQTSSYIRKQWDARVIFEKACDEEKVEILNPFLRAGWLLPSSKHVNGYFGKDICCKLLSFESIRSSLPDQVVLHMLRQVPEVVMQYFDVKSLKGHEIDTRNNRAYRVLLNASRYDLIDQIYRREELPIWVQFDIAIWDHLEKNLQNTEIVRELMIQTDLVCREETIDYYVEYGTVDKIRRLINLVGVENLTEGAINDILVEFVKQGTRDDVAIIIRLPNSLDQCIDVYFSLIDNIDSDIEENIQYLEDHLLSVIDYSHIDYHNWEIRSVRGKAMLRHMKKHGYSENSDSSDSE